MPPRRRPPALSVPGLLVAAAALMLALPAVAQEASWQRMGAPGGIYLDPQSHGEDALARAFGPALGRLSAAVHDEAGARRALAVLAALGSLADSDPDALAAKARAYHRLREFGLAESAYTRWLAAVPSDHAGRVRMAVYLERARRQQDLTAAGDAFRDCAECPELVVVPAGSFTMGSPQNEKDRDSDEGPQRAVTIARAFGVGKFEITFAEGDACVAGGGCGGYRPSDSGWGRGTRPVINVSWDDAKGYVEWLGRKTGKPYRLLSEAEWEYAARAGTTTRYGWGNEIGRSNANCDGCGSQWDNRQTAPAGSFQPNGFGLHDMHGNVWEWTEDCWHGSYAGAPVDGGAWVTGGECGRRVLRGGSWGNFPGYLRSAGRDGVDTGYRLNYRGIRVARTLN